MVKIALNALGGRYLNMEMTGNSRPILAIHGFTGNLSTWDLLSETVRSEYSVISLDLLGHGSSDAPTVPELYGIESTVGALAELMDKLGFRRVHWLGYSLGGRVALAAALLLAERTLSVTLVSASPGLATLGERAERIHRDEELAGKIETEGIEAFVDYWEALPLWASQVRLPEETRQKLRLQRLANNSVGLANSLRGIGIGAQPSFHELLSELRVPTLFIAGAEDEKFASIAQEMHCAVMNSRLCIVPKSGHTVHLEQPLLFNQIILGFLRTVKDSDTHEARIMRSQPNP